MEEVMVVTLVSEIKAFGGRVYDFAAGLGASEQPSIDRLRRFSADASRHMVRATRGDPRSAQLSIQAAFKLLARSVDTLDEIAARRTDVGVEASALAAEATELCQEIFDRIPEEVR